MLKEKPTHSYSKTPTQVETPQISLSNDETGLGFAPSMNDEFKVFAEEQHHIDEEHGTKDIPMSSKTEKTVSDKCLVLGKELVDGKGKLSVLVEDTVSMNNLDFKSTEDYG